MKRGRSNISHANLLFGDSKYNVFSNASVSSDASKLNKGTASEQIIYDPWYPHNDRVNSNYIKSVDLKYSSKANWHNQGPLSHDIMLRANPKDIISKITYDLKIYIENVIDNTSLNKQYKQDLLATHHEDKHDQNEAYEVMTTANPSNDNDIKGKFIHQIRYRIYHEYQYQGINVWSKS